MTARRHPRTAFLGASLAGLAVAGLAASQCRATGHAVTPSALGSPSGTAALEALVDLPGPVEVETVASTSWALDRSGIIDLDHPRARDAGLEEGEEAIEVFFHVLRHPGRGTFLVDTGVERALRDAPEQAAASGLVRRAMHYERLGLERPLGDWLASSGGKLDGVFLTHLHLDHVSGLPDVPRDTPVHAGPGEAGHASVLNLATRGTLDRDLEGLPPLSEWRFEADPQGAFEGVVDVFGDGSVFALLVPGHTVGSTAYLVRSTRGPVLLVGDTCASAWGWEHEVAPGRFTSDHAGNALSLARLKRLVAAHPSIDVRLGHQRLPGPPGARVGR
jgi:glyoxylase-like metal-dependent hydrolase (beta-lactamase superfamily II)